MAPKKLFHVTTVPWQLWGFFENQAEFMRSRGFEVHGVCSPGELVKKIREREKIEVHEIPIRKSFSPFADLVSLARLYFLLRRHRPDIVHTHSPKAGLLGMLAAAAAGIPTRFHTLHGLVTSRTGGNSQRRVLTLTEKITCRLARRVFCVSESVKRRAVEQRLCAPEKAVVPHHGSANGIDAAVKFNPALLPPQRRTEIRAAAGIPEGDLCIGFCGRLVPDKGMNELAEAWRRLRDESGRTHLLLVGPTDPAEPLPPEVLRRLEEDRRVHFTGMALDLAPYYAAIDIFVLPSHREGLSTVILEAAAMGKPVVATKIPGCEELVADGETGILCAPRDAGGLAEALRGLIRDEPKRTAMGKAGRAFVFSRFRPEDVWAATAEAYGRP